MSPLNSTTPTANATTNTTYTNTNTNAVRIVEVGPRDGLQNFPRTVPTAVKIELIRRLYAANVRTIELTSVVSPKAIPQLADCRQVLADPKVGRFLEDRSLRLPVLVPNLRGLNIAVEHRVKEVAVFVSASEGFSRANTNCTVEEGLQRAEAVARQALTQGLQVRGYVSSIFACPYDGPTPPDAVLHCVKRLLDAGCYEVSLGDTLGVGVAAKTRALVRYLLAAGIPASSLAGHFHDTYGQAVANVWAAYECGLRVFDSSIAGLGGCPYAPGAKGNVATEDLVYLFHQAGVTTGVNLDALVETGVWVSNTLSRENESRAGKALAVKAGLKAQTPTLQKGTGTGTSKASHALTWEKVGPNEANDELLVQKSGVNVKITLNRPKNGNALTTTMIERLTKFFEDAATSHPSVSRIIIAANGRFFCTGMDLSANGTRVSKGGSSTEIQYQILTRLFDAIARAPQVTIACVQGPAFGGGVGLAFACDVRIAVRSAWVKLSEVRLGLCPATISKYVIREWGFAFAREAMLSGRQVAAGELAQLGVVAKLADDLAGLSKVLDQYLTELRGSAPKASTMCKDLVQLAWVHAGEAVQLEGIKKNFDQMMSPDAEAAFGVSQLQKGVKTVDWDARLTGTAAKAKL
ncbi:hydroxymethylglutaryl-CoA lyase [Capronia epimyces CBS 606.96]|uniref:hydroxymethylglutaryl-CoA lyase n=1 Tax=Capronia epimyces CBS 606.96 TaxID=1182542 RepID=W9XI69_9EURO|nr:hydroxymethylglutaryl-CoA lyase [Capronia epimyces CBS 606.96]EXJ77045.1 hydroxymethylglutaryl-CoA lyase [Capronia epimyces CBS 606.96]